MDRSAAPGDQPAFAHTDPPSWMDAFPSSTPPGRTPQRDKATSEIDTESRLDGGRQPSAVGDLEVGDLDWSGETRAPRTEDPRWQAAHTPFDDDRMLRRRSRSMPAHGWRRLVHRLTGGLIRPGQSQAELRTRRLVATLTQPIPGSRTIAVVSTKGGVGKTSTTINLGHTFAAFRGDRVVALDGNPDAGSLAYRIKRETKATITELLSDLTEDGLYSYVSIRRFTSQAPSRLEVIASPENPRVSRTLSKDDYQRVLELLRSHFTLVLADCGTGILDSITQGIVESAEQLIVVTSPSIDSARAVSFLLSWLIEHGHAALVTNAVVVINAVPRKTGPINLGEIEQHFAERVRAVVRIPWDHHLNTGATTALEDLSPATRDAYLHLAAAVADGFAWTR